ncbi:MAG: Anaphase-promoting complex subunit 23 [Candelina mexicana]|nr:MAG: Anaphase-promoting complex subunit 23 [Candelina mexicana]
MAPLSSQDVEHLRGVLQPVVVKCSERCLYQSAKWTAELLSSLPSISDLTPTSDTDSDSQMHNSEPPPRPPPIVVTTNDDPREAHLESQEIDKYLLAKSFFDCREYDRCAAVFLPSTLPRGPISASSPQTTTIRTPTSTKAQSKKPVRSDTAAPPPSNSLPRLSQKALFLALYAKYMSGEKRKDEESEMILGPADGGSTVNRELVGIGRALEGWFAERSNTSDQGANDGHGQGWLEYLYGVVLAKGKNEEEAKRWLMKSIHHQPYHWGAWLELSELIGGVEELNNISATLHQNLMTWIFLLYTSQELYQAGEAPHPSDFESAESIFASLIQTDPHRIDSLDHYSNILYVMANRPKLAFLAQLATATDKFRPETCCVVGNYYSLKSEHEKAVMYFRRALTLDRNFLSAWTLMGHEYVEMKNTHAAIESYRRAVDVNRKDYRAWYGLGQTYEVLEMHFYALFYYQRAASLKPYDPKMWQAVGSCFQKMGRLEMSVKALKRALVAGSYYSTGSSFGSGDTEFPSSGGGGGGGGNLDPETLFQIAVAYEKLQEVETAREYMELTLAQEEGGRGNDVDGDDDDVGEDEDRRDGGGAGTGVTPTTSRARMWLARWELGHGGFKRALELATELCQDGVEVEEAKALVRDVRARMEGGG